eukprot:scaffold59528_cov50-Attheya_sp.AAC.2
MGSGLLFVNIIDFTSQRMEDVDVHPQVSVVTVDAIFKWEHSAPSYSSDNVCRSYHVRGG